MSERLTKKRHWNAFNTDFFMPAQTVITTLERDGKLTVGRISGVSFSARLTVKWFGFSALIWPRIFKNAEATYALSTMQQVTWTYAEGVAPRCQMWSWTSRPHLKKNEVYACLQRRLDNCLMWLRHHILTFLGVCINRRLTQRPVPPLPILSRGNPLTYVWMVWIYNIILSIIEFCKFFLNMLKRVYWSILY